MLDVRREVVEHIEAYGLQLDGAPPRGVRATAAPAELYAASPLFLFVKPTDTLGALRPFAGKLNPETPIVSLQNGLGNEEAIKTALGGNIALVMGATTEAALVLGPGQVRRLGVGTTVLGARGASDDGTKRVADLLAAGQMRATVVYDIRPHLWGKLLANAAINPLSALLDAENGAIPRDPNAAEVARAILAEAAAVAGALRIRLPFDDAWRYVCEVIDATSDVRSSMADDLAAGRRTEIDAINGAIVAAGRRAGVATPYNDAITRLIKAREALAAQTS